MSDFNGSTKISHGFKSKSSIDTKEVSGVNLNIDNELEHFVSMIEENTFAILSIKQKFGLMQGNGKVFKDETIEKLDSFEKQINEIEKRVSSSFQIFNQRLDHMELLGFRPSSYHPAKMIKINDNHQITTAFYTSEYVYIGTDTSRIILFSSKTLQFSNEIGPIDGSAIVQIGLLSRDGNHILAVKTASNQIHIIDILQPSQKRVLTTNIFATWPTNLPSPFRMTTIENGSLNFYDDDLNIAFSIKIEAQSLFPGPDKLFVVNNDFVSIFNLEEEVHLKKEIQLPFAPTLISSSRISFVASGSCNDVAIVNFNGDYRLVNVGGPSRFLFTWGSYYFRVGNDTLIECRNFHDKKDKLIKIGDPSWWPHTSQTPLAACGIMESTLITALGLKCVLWN